MVPLGIFSDLFEVNEADVSNLKDDLELSFSLWNKLIDAIQPVITKPPSEVAPGAYAAVTSYAGNLVGFAEGLLVLVFCIGVFGATASFTEHKNWTAMLRLAARFILAKTGIDCIATAPLGSTGKSILQTIDAIVYEAQKLIFGGEISTDTLHLHVDGELEAYLTGEMSLWEWLVSDMFVSIFLYIALAYCGIRIFLIVYGRIFKIYIMTAISPIPMSFFGSQTTQRTGVGFIRTYTVTLCEVLIIILAFAIFNAFANSFDVLTGGDLRLQLLSVVLKCFVLVAVIQGSERTLREIAG